MPSAPSPQTDRTFQQLQEILGQVADSQENRLLQEAEALQLRDLAEVWDGLSHADPAEFLRVYREENPKINLGSLETQDPYRVAVGVLKVLSPEAL